jgi:hypothetical protein
MAGEDIVIDDSGNVRKKGATTITRIIGYRLSNGMWMEAPVEIWLTALIQSLPEDHVAHLFPIVERLKQGTKIVPLSDGMGLVQNPILGVKQ